MERLKGWYVFHFGELQDANQTVNLIVLALVLGAPITRVPVITVAATAALGLIALYRYGRGLKPDGISLLVFINYGYWLLSALAIGLVPLSMFFHYNFWRWDGRIFFAYIPLLFFLSSRFSANQAKTLLACMLLVCVPICLAGILQYAARSDLGLPIAIAKPNNSGLWEFHGLMKSHNAAGSFYGGVSLASIVLLTTAWRERFLLPRSWMLGATGVVFLAFVLSLSREGYIAFAAGFLLFVPRLIKMHIPWRTVAALGLFAVAVAILGAVEANVPERITGTSLNDRNVDKRIEFWTTSIELIPKSPVLGIGFSRWNDYRYVDNGRYYFKGFKGVAMTLVNAPVVSNKGNPHNSYFAFLVETGFAGLALVITLWWTIWRRLSAIDVSAAENGDFMPALKLAALCFVPYALIAALVGHALSSPSTLLPFAIVAGLAIAVSNRATQSETSQEGF